jgi:flavin reductase (DIM6/NTAB) family NADH-FMN oxidoreductase RutF
MKVEFSRLHRLFYPQVPLVLSARHGDRVSAMPVVSYVSISDAPPLLGVACTPHTFTYKLALKARCFSLTLLDEGELGAIERLATVSGAKVEDKLAEVGLRHTRGTKVGAPVIAGAAATIECSVSSKRRMGDHTMLVGKAEACYASEDFSDFWRFEKYRPILYTGWKDGMTTYPWASARRR